MLFSIRTIAIHESGYRVFGVPACELLAAGKATDVAHGEHERQRGDRSHAGLRHQKELSGTDCCHQPIGPASGKKAPGRL